MAHVAPVRPKINTKPTQLARGRAARADGESGPPGEGPSPRERGHTPVSPELCPAGDRAGLWGGGPPGYDEGSERGHRWASLEVSARVLGCLTATATTPSRRTDPPISERRDRHGAARIASRAACRVRDRQGHRAISGRRHPPSRHLQDVRRTIIRRCTGVIAFQWWQARRIPAGSKIGKGRGCAAEEGRLGLMGVVLVRSRSAARSAPLLRRCPGCGSQTPDIHRPGEDGPHERDGSDDRAL